MAFESFQGKFETDDIKVCQACHKSYTRAHCTNPNCVMFMTEEVPSSEAVSFEDYPTPEDKTAAEKFFEQYIKEEKERKDKAA